MGKTEDIALEAFVGSDLRLERMDHFDDPQIVTLIASVAGVLDEWKGAVLDCWPEGELYLNVHIDELRNALQQYDNAHKTK